MRSQALTWTASCASWKRHVLEADALCHLHSADSLARAHVISAEDRPDFQRGPSREPRRDERPPRGALGWWERKSSCLAPRVPAGKVEGCFLSETRPRQRVVFVSLRGVASNRRADAAVVVRRRHPDPMCFTDTCELGRTMQLS